MGETTHPQLVNAGFLPSTVGTPKIDDVYICCNHFFHSGSRFEVPAVSFLGCNCVTTGGKRNVSSPFPMNCKQFTTYVIWGNGLMHVYCYFHLGKISSILWTLHSFLWLWHRGNKITLMKWYNIYEHFNVIFQPSQVILSTVPSLKLTVCT